jgi:hypothetical protein
VQVEALIGADVRRPGRRRRRRRAPRLLGPAACHSLLSLVSLGGAVGRWSVGQGATAARIIVIIVHAPWRPPHLACAVRRRTHFTHFTHFTRRRRLHRAARCLPSGPRSLPPLPILVLRVRVEITGSFMIRSD